MANETSKTNVEQNLELNGIDEKQIYNIQFIWPLILTLCLMTIVIIFIFCWLCKQKRKKHVILQKSSESIPLFTVSELNKRD